MMGNKGFLSEENPIDRDHPSPNEEHGLLYPSIKTNDSHISKEKYIYFYDPVMERTSGEHFTTTTGTYTNVSSENLTTIMDDTRDEDLAKIEITVQAVIFAMALIGNSLVLIALRYRKKKTSRMHMYILHLSIADLLVAFCNILPQLAWDITFRFQGNDFLCRVVKYLQVMVMYLSTYILIATAVDRYRSICHPLSIYNWSSRNTHIPVGIAWVLSLVLAMPQVFIFQKTEIPNIGKEDCWANFQPEWTLYTYVTAFFITVYIIPFLVLAVLYGRICFEVCRNFSFEKKFPLVGYKSNSGGIIYKFNGTGHISVIGNSHSGSSSSSSGTRDTRRHSGHKVISRAKLKTVKLTFVVVIAYLLCWSPFMITQMWWAYDKHAPYNGSVFVICLLLASLNSCVNPWIYMAFSGNLLKQIFPCCRNRCPKPPLRLRERVRSVEDLQINKPPHKIMGQKGDKDGDKLLRNGQRFRNARSRLSSLKNTLFTRSQSTKVTGTSDTFRYRLRRGSRDKDNGNMISMKSNENGLRVHRVQKNYAGVNQFQFGDIHSHRHGIGNAKYVTYPYLYQKPCMRIKPDIKHTSV